MRAWTEFTELLRSKQLSHARTHRTPKALRAKSNQACGSVVLTTLKVGCIHHLPCYRAACLPIRQRNRNPTKKRGPGRKATSAKRRTSFNHRAKRFLKARGTCASAPIGSRNERAEPISCLLQPLQ